MVTVTIEHEPFCIDNTALLTARRTLLMLTSRLQNTSQTQMESVSWDALAAPNQIAAWDNLALQVVEPNPFCESWYLLPSLRHLLGNKNVQILQLRIGGQLCGLMPIAHSSRYYRYPLPHLTNWQHANMFCGVPLVAKGAETAFWQALLDWVDQHAGSALFLHLRDIPLNGVLYDALISTLSDQNRLFEQVYAEDRALLASQNTPDAYWEASVSPKKRKELRRQSKRLGEIGYLECQCTMDLTDLSDWCQSFLRLEQAGWKGKAGSALASSEQTQALFCESLAGAAERGRLERRTITLDGQPIAMLASFLTPPGAFSFKTTFDERFSKYSPGVLLQQENLGILEHSEIEWTDSCAAADHPMIDHIWRERRKIGRLSIAIGGAARRCAFRQIVRAETKRGHMS